MPHRPAARLLASLAAATLAATALGACSDEPDDTVRAPSVTAMLERVPDTKVNRRSVVVSLYAKAEADADLKPEGKAGQQRELRRLSRLTNGVDAGTGLPGGDITGGAYAAKQYGKLGYVPSDVTAEVTFGEPPEQASVGVGTFDADRVLDKAAEVEGAETSDVDGTKVVSWLDDLQIDRDLETPIGSLPGQSGRIALPGDGLLAYAKSDVGMQQILDTADGERKSLADDEDLRAVAEGLDDADVSGAYLSTEPIDASRSSRPRPAGAPPTEGRNLVPYVAFGTGAAIDDGAKELVVVLVHEDEAAAEENAKRLRTIVAEGASAATAQRWNTLLRSPDIEQDGRVVEATFEVDNPTLWFQVVQQQDTLLATS